jgi:hypothetical protein
MSALDIKLLRDIRRLWAQVLAIALVIGGGVATLVLAVGAHRSLEETRVAYYERYGFADVFAQVKRAPKALADRIAEIPGVAAVDTRISKLALLDIPGFAEPASGQFVSLPDSGEPMLNRLYIRAGRLPEPGRAEEVVVNETFARAWLRARCAFPGNPEREEARTGDRRHRALAGVHLYGRARRPHAGRPAFRRGLDIREGPRQRLRSRWRVLLRFAEAAAGCLGARGDYAA